MAKKKKRSQEEIDFIKGRTNKLRLNVKKKSLGFSPTEKTASGSGFHGKNKQAKSKAERRVAKKELKNKDW
jgi:hypothetical protein